MLNILLNAACPVSLRSLLGLDLLDGTLTSLFDVTLLPMASLALVLVVVPLAHVLERLLGAAPTRAGHD